MFWDRDQIQKRKELVNLMLELHGKDYTLGWLMSAYTEASVNYEYENSIVKKTLDQLLELKANNKAF